MVAIRRILPLCLAVLAGCTEIQKVRRSHLGSIDPRDYESTDIRAYGDYFPDPVDTIEPTALTVTFLGTTSMLLDDGKSQILVDGFITRRNVFSLARAIESDWELITQVLSRVKASRVAGVLVAHSHYDHAFDSAHVAKWTGSPLYGSPSTLNLGHGAGLPVGRLVPFRPCVEVAVGTFGVTALPSVHSPPDLYNDNLGEEIEAPLRQPYRPGAMVEGGSFDFLIRSGSRRILLRPGAGYRAGGLDGIQADILFLAVGSLGNQPPLFRNAYYDETVGRVRPRLIIPVHWDSFFRPLLNSRGDTVPLRGMPEAIDNVREGLDSVIARARHDGIPVMLLDALDTVPLDGYFSGRPAETVGGCPRAD
jgi:L-ascorbate metabolism protein UlaG (beta-lactamase superfamily)